MSKGEGSFTIRFSFRVCRSCFERGKCKGFVSLYANRERFFKQQFMKYNMKSEYMSLSNDQVKETFSVVFNHEEQYSIWPTGRDVPAGWNEAGVSGTKEECLAYISEVWTDMRPLSLRKAMANTPDQ